MPSYIQDTNDFLRKINKIEKIPDNSYLLSLDVRSLYTSIKAIKRSLESFPERTVATSNHYFFIVDFDVKQFCVQLQKLFTRLRHGNNLRNGIC